MFLIDRKALVRACMDYFNGENQSRGFHKGGHAAVRLIYQQPFVDAVEIVRCKDCKNWGFAGRCCLLSSSKYTLTMDGNAYCSYGERKE